MIRTARESPVAVALTRDLPHLGLRAVAERPTRRRGARFCSLHSIRAFDSTRTFSYHPVAQCHEMTPGWRSFADTKCNRIVTQRNSEGCGPLAPGCRGSQTGRALSRPVSTDMFLNTISATVNTQRYLMIGAAG